MTTRTVKMLGLAYGSTPAEIAVTLDGATIYTGTVTTVDTLVPAMPATQELLDSTIELCSFDLPVDFAGNKSMTCSVTNGTVVFAEITANYCTYADSDPVVGSGPDTYYPINLAGDCRSNVTIDGVAQAANPAELAGSWWYKVLSGSTLAYDLVVQAGTEAVAPVTP